MKTPPSMRAGIVASIGRTLCGVPLLTEAIRAGAWNFRLPFGLRDRDLVQDFADIRAASDAAGVAVNILIDLPASRPRVGRMPELSFAPGDRVTVRDAAACERNSASEIPLPGLTALLPKLGVGHRLFFRDGRQQFQIMSVGAASLEAECLGCVEPLRACNGCVFPDSALTFEPVTAIDLETLERCRAAGLRPDWALVSFATEPAHIRGAREALEALWPGDAVRIMAKIETAAAVENLDALLDVADGLLVGRGDLGLSLAPERIPRVQERIVRAGVSAGKPATVATQFLEIFAQRGEVYRAELSDVALAARQGAAAIVLCAETNDSPRPIECVAFARRIIEAAGDEQA